MDKKCSKCGAVKPETEFGKNRNQCKMCIVEKTREWRVLNPEKHRKLNREYAMRNRALNPEKVNGIFRKWKSKNPEKVKECYRKWSCANPENVMKNRKKWYNNNPEKAGAMGYFHKLGLSMSEVPPELFQAKVDQLKMLHELKQIKEMANGND